MPSIIRPVRSFLLIFFSILLTSALNADEPAWFNNGQPMQDTENAKSKDGFGAQLWLTSNNIENEWDQSAPPKLAITKRVKRNTPVSVAIVIINPPSDENGRCDVIGDLLIRQPDGKVYADIKDIEIFKNRPAPPKDSMALGEQPIAIMIEDNEPLGAYSIDFLVKDRVKQLTFPLHYEFIAEERGVNGGVTPSAR